MTTVFVSGCYDILHGGHIQFFNDASALGDELIVCVANDDVIRQHKGREPAMPQGHRYHVVDAVIAGISHRPRTFLTQAGQQLGMDFEDHFRRLRPDILATTEDDQFAAEKKALCSETGAHYVQLRKASGLTPVSTTDIRSRICGTERVPLRVDFAGGWLDVPRLAIEHSFIVNCAISPCVSRSEWPYEVRGGLGGSAAWAILNGRDPIAEELTNGVGWQDPAVIQETGLCVWVSGPRPVLELRTSGEWLRGRMAISWTGREHDTASLVDHPDRAYESIVQAGAQAKRAVEEQSIRLLALAMNLSYEAQTEEGMAPLVDDTTPSRGVLGIKYLGSGWGGYALHLFEDVRDRDKFVTEEPAASAIEPYDRWRNNNGS